MYSTYCGWYTPDQYTYLNTVMLSEVEGMLAYRVVANSICGSLNKDKFRVTDAISLWWEKIAGPCN